MTFCFYWFHLVFLTIFYLAHAIDIESLLQQMTLEQKAGQMAQIDIAAFFNSTSQDIDYDKLESWVNQYQLGSMLNSIFSGGPLGELVSWNAAQWRYFVNRIQLIAQNTALKIPIIYGIDSIHGASYVYGAALFPHAIGVAASFDPTHAYVSGAVSSKDTRASGIPWLFSPGIF